MRKVKLKPEFWRLPTFADVPLSSALAPFTTEFGMGSGGTTPVLSPELRL